MGSWRTRASAFAQAATLVYFVATRPDWYRPFYPAYVVAARFRGRVLVAYSSRCTICALTETRLLDAAHIVGDLQARGEPVVSNGLSLCSIHHRAFDQDLVGVSPDYAVHVSRRLLDDEDGPMLELLKAFHGRTIELPSRAAWRPDRERLAERFERFAAAG